MFHLHRFEHQKRLALAALSPAATRTSLPSPASAPWPRAPPGAAATAARASGSATVKSWARPSANRVIWPGQRAIPAEPSPRPAAAGAGRRALSVRRELDVQQPPVGGPERSPRSRSLGRRSAPAVAGENGRSPESRPGVAAVAAGAGTKGEQGGGGEHAPGGGIAGHRALAAGDQSGIDIAGGKIGVAGERRRERRVGGRAGDLGLASAPRQRGERGIAVGRRARSAWRSSDRRRARSRRRPARRCRCAAWSRCGAAGKQMMQRAGRRQETARRVFGIEPRLDGMAVERDLVLRAAAAARRRRRATAIRPDRAPVTISVTGCSTCRRVFISMN